MNNYIPVDYADDVDNGVFDYSYFGPTVFCSTIIWVDCAQTDLIEFNPIIDKVETDTGLIIGKGVSSSVYTELKNIIIKWYRHPSQSSSLKMLS